jgi:hypothetical protein
MPAVSARSPDPELDVFAVDPGSVRHLWPVLGPYIQRGLDFGYDAYELEECRRRLEYGPGGEEPKLLAVVVIERGQELPLLVLTLELVEVQGIGRTCHYVTAGGEEMLRWIDWLEPIMVEIAREQGAEYLTTKGRPGWARTLKPYGYEHLYTICGKKVNP